MCLRRVKRQTFCDHVLFRTDLSDGNDVNVV